MLSARFRHLFLLAIAAFLPATMALAQKADSPTGAVEAFFKAVSDSNIKAMGNLWGNNKGPVSATKPEGWEKKIVVMSTWYVGVKYRALGESDSSDPNKRTVTTELSRGRCKVVISVIVMKSSAGWLVNSFDSDQAQQVNRLCEGG